VLRYSSANPNSVTSSAEQVGFSTKIGFTYSMNFPLRVAATTQMWYLPAHKLFVSRYENASSPAFTVRSTRYR